MDTPTPDTLEQNLAHLRRQDEHSLRGFEPHYKNIVDYILRITHRIWEEGDLGYIYDTYLGNVSVHTGYGTTYGVEEVVSSSVAFAAAVPDRRIYAKDVLWTGDDERGFHTSHLLVSKGTNTGYSPWAPPTGRRIELLAVANCFVRENRVIEEWLVRDTAAMVRQLGLDLWEVARDAAALWPVSVTGETDRLQGQYPPAAYQPQDQAEPHEDLIRQLFHDVWNARHFNRVTERYAEDSSLHVPNHLTLRGVANIRAYHLNFVAMFPDAHMSVEHVYGSEDSDGYRAAVRWRFSGTHARYGWYGKPTHKRVNILGISHLHIVDEEVKEHFMVFDDLAVAMQLVG